MNEKFYDLLNQVQKTAVQVGGVASDAAYGAGKKAEELASCAKAKLKEMDTRAEVNLKLRELGELVYATHTGNPTDSEVLLAKLKEIDELKAQLPAEPEKPAEEPEKTCSTCGAEVPEDSAFCGECGSPCGGEEE